jgi:glyoxylase-like metal-dependent hydrolase (beta-lactamase superfamily II)
LRCVTLFHAGAVVRAAGTGKSRGAARVVGAALSLCFLLSARLSMAACMGLPLPSLEPVAPQVWRVAAAEGESTPDNGGLVTESVLVQERDRLWLVGSGPTPARGEALACAIEAALGRKVTDLINTRAHPELAMGNTAFAAARVWALDDVARAMAARCRECLARLAQRIGGAGARLDDSAIRVPDKRLGADGASQGQLGPFQWWALPRAKGERTLVLRLRERPIVIAQGLVWPAAVPNLRDTESALMLDSLRALRGIAKGAITVLGEQGPTGTTEDINSHMDYLVSLRAAVRARVRNGADANTAIEAISLPMFGKRLGNGEIDALNRQRVWREMENASFRR